jgi:hypothetical protein
MATVQLAVYRLAQGRGGVGPLLLLVQLVLMEHKDASPPQQAWVYRLQALAPCEWRDDDTALWMLLGGCRWGPHLHTNTMGGRVYIHTLHKRATIFVHVMGCLSHTAWCAVEGHSITLAGIRIT